MKALGIVVGAAPLPLVCSSARNHRFRVSSSSSGSKTVEQVGIAAAKPEYKPGVFDDMFLNLFRSKLVQEVGWDSKEPGYDGLIEVAHRLMMKNTSNSTTVEAAVRILRSLFPPYLLELYKMLIAPIGGGKIAAMMMNPESLVLPDVPPERRRLRNILDILKRFGFEARVTVLTCQWLMGPCKVNSVDLPDGTSCSSGVYVERCRYLEESKCVGICTNTCKFPTQTFFKDHMGVPLLMEPNFGDYSCQFKFGVLPPRDDTILKEPCLEACPNASRRRMVAKNVDVTTCPKT